MRAELIDYVSRHANSSSIPVPYARPYVQYEGILEAKKILDDTTWEVVGVTDEWVYFRRWYEGEYGKG